ncbi:LamG-like jellyroll fold domain-containing protein [Thiolapillus sp.]|uniref:LamG-like jellyroll fold domain-containing protein n=1 Tax=Thiolapillus sp. TaxID=2017437 RepID=UPI003AF7201D
MALLHLSDMLRVEGFERMHSQFTRLTILEDYPADYAEIAANEFGHVDLTPANFERSTSADDEVVVAVKGIPAVDVLYDDLDLRYIALHGTTSPNYYAVMSIKSTGYMKGEAVVIPDFSITLKINDSNQHLSADMIWQGNASFSTKCGRVMLCEGVPKTRNEVSQMHMGTKVLQSTDFESVGSGADLRMMLKEQRMPPATRAGRVQSVAMLELSSTDNFAVSRISNPINIAQGAIVDINGVGFKIEQGSGSPGNPSKKPTVPVKINRGSPLSRDLLYFTFDFKKELVKNYDMPHVGTGIEWDATTKNVKFVDPSTETVHNHIQLGSDVDDGNLLGQAVTIIFKFRQPANTGTKGTIFTNFNDVDDSQMEVDIPDNLGGISFWAGKWASTPVSTVDLKKWKTYAVRRGDDIADDVSVFVDGLRGDIETNAPARRYSGQPFLIGGYDAVSGGQVEWSSFVGELEYFAVWKRALSDAEVAEFTDKPYSIVEHKANVDKPLTYQAIDETKAFAKNLRYYTCSWVDDIVNYRPLYPESSPAAHKAQIDPDTDNLIFDGNYNDRQEVNFGGPDMLSVDSFTVSIRLKLHANALSKPLDHALWGFPASGNDHVEASITGTKAAGYSIVFTIGPYSISASADWGSMSDLKTWSFVYNSNDRIAIYKESDQVATKDISGRHVGTSGGIRVGHNDGSTRPAFPGEVEYISVWNDVFNSVRLHDFLEYPYAHLKRGLLRDEKPIGRGSRDHFQTMVDGLTTYVFSADNELVRNLQLRIEGEADVVTNTEFKARQTVFNIQTVKQATLQRYDTYACVKGHRHSSAPYEPDVPNRTITFRAKLLPKPPGAPSDVVPHQSTLFCSDDSSAESRKHQRWHVYYYGNGTSDPQIVFEYGDMWLKYPYPLADALNFHDFAFMVEQFGNDRKLSIWIDGVMVDSKRNANTYAISNLQFRLGGYRDLLDLGHIHYIRFKGVVDSYGIWDRALNEAEIKKIHREPYVPVIPNHKAKPNPEVMDLSIKPMDLTRDMRFYTLDFKREMVQGYDMPSRGSDIEWMPAPSFNVKFKNASELNRIYLSTQDFATFNHIPTDNFTIMFKTKSSELTNAHGNYFCIAGGGGNERLCSHCAWVSTDNKYRWPIDIGEYTQTRIQPLFGDGSTKTPVFPTMTIRLKKTGSTYSRTAFVNGSEVGNLDSTHPGKYYPSNWLVLGGWNTGSSYRGGIFEMEFFAMWDRALSNDEIAEMYANPYAIIQGMPKALIDPTITVIDPEEEA